jgi:hypothetical protein
MDQPRRSVEPKIQRQLKLIVLDIFNKSALDFKLIRGRQTADFG